MVSLDRYPSSQNVYRSIYISIVRRATTWTSPIPVPKCEGFVLIFADVADFRCRLPPSRLGECFSVFSRYPLKYPDELTESKVGDFSTPQAFHTLKIQGFYGLAHRANRLLGCQSVLDSTGDITHIFPFSWETFTYHAFIPCQVGGKHIALRLCLTCLPT